MAPLRRYLRLTRHSILETRIYLETPSDTPWLLSTHHNAALPRIVSAVRPCVLPKLREENAHAAGKGGGGKKGKGRGKAVKDVVAGEDFEVTVFLVEGGSRHSLLTRRREVAGKGVGVGGGKGSLGEWLGGGREDPVVVGEGAAGVAEVLREEGEGEVSLADIPEVGTAGGKRKVGGGVEKEEGEALFVSSSDEETFATQRARRTKSRKRGGQEDVQAAAAVEEECEDEDDKKKMGLRTSYDGFSIYGRTLCLVVKRKGKKAAAPAAKGVPLGGSQMMEQWVSTQVQQEGDYNDDDDDG